MIDKPQPVRERKTPRQALDGAPQHETAGHPGAILSYRGAPIHFGFPVSISPVFLQEFGKGGISIVIHRRRQMPGRALKDDVLMHLVVSRPLEVAGESLVDSQTLAEQTQVPTGEVAGMIDPVSEEVEAAVQVEARRRAPHGN